MRLLSLRAVATMALVLITSAPCGLLLAQQVATSSSLPDAPGLQSLNSEEVLVSDESEAAPENSKRTALHREPGSISGTVTDLNGNLVPGATVILDGPHLQDHSEVVADDNAGFAFNDLQSEVPYRVSVKLNGFADWTSAPIILAPGQNDLLTDVRLKIEGASTSIAVYASNKEVAAAQVQLEEQQRSFGFIPNFYVVYDSKSAVSLTTKLKFKLAMRLSVDPVTVGEVAFMAGVNQAADRPNYVQGAKGYGQRFGAIAADRFSNIIIGNAIIPSLLHQDPRYFYQGTGSTNSRLKHAVLSPFICSGDNGRLQPNYSSLGGSLVSSALSNAYYPQSNRGVGLVLGAFAIGTAERVLNGIAQEFILPRFTHRTWQ